MHPLSFHELRTAANIVLFVEVVLIVLVRWLKLIVFSFITSSCRHRWICRCVYCLCWHICTICDTKREISDSTKNSQFLLVITTRTVYPRQELIITVNLRRQCNSLVIFMYRHAFMHTWRAFLIVIASLWFKKSQQLFWIFMPLRCLGFCCSYCFTQIQMTSPSLPWFTSVYFFVGMTVTGVWLTSLTPRVEWAATAQTPTAQSASRQRAPTKRRSPSPPTCQPLAPSTHSCRVSVFCYSSQGEQARYFVSVEVRNDNWTSCFWYLK